MFCQENYIKTLEFAALAHKDQKIIDEGYRVVSERAIDKVGTEIKGVYEEILEDYKAKHGQK